MYFLPFTLLLFDFELMSRYVSIIYRLLCTIWPA